MNEEQQATTSQEEEAGRAQEATEEQDQTIDEQTQGQEQTFGREYVEKLRRENAGYRTKLKEIEDAEKTELQRFQEENENLRTENGRLQTSARRSTFIERINLPSPRLAWASLSDLSVDVEWDENGNPKNLADVRKALKAEFPREFGDGSANGSERGPEPQANDMNSLIRGAAGRG